MAIKLGVCLWLAAVACVASPVFLLVTLAACVALLLLHFLRDG